MDWILTGGTGLDGAPLDLQVSDGLLADSAGSGARRFDATGLILAPGICDVHGDGFERNLSPRPGVSFDMDTGLLETDRQLIANGITTAWLALTISWEPGLRSLEMARQTLAAIERLRPHFRADIRVQLRWEIFALDAVPELEQWIAMKPRPVIAFNDHLTSMMNGVRMIVKLGEYASRAGLSEEDYTALIKRTADRADEVPAAIERLSRVAAGHGVACFSHDEPDPDARRQNRATGITVSEFPLTDETAQEAVSHDEPTVLGAPNVLRGGSHIGAMNAAPAVAGGLCTVLASDYYYPAQLRAITRLETDNGMPPAETWPLISVNAAQAGGLTDRGTLETGKRADLLALRRVPHGFDVEAVMVAGRMVSLSDPARLAA